MDMICSQIRTRVWWDLVAWTYKSMSGNPLVNDTLPQLLIRIGPGLRGGPTRDRCRWALCAATSPIMQPAARRIGAPDRGAIRHRRLQKGDAPHIMQGRPRLPVSELHQSHSSDHEEMMLRRRSGCQATITRSVVHHPALLSPTRLAFFPPAAVAMHEVPTGSLTLWAIDPPSLLFGHRYCPTGRDSSSLGCIWVMTVVFSSIRRPSLSKRRTVVSVFPDGTISDSALTIAGFVSARPVPRPWPSP